MPCIITYMRQDYIAFMIFFLDNDLLPSFISLSLTLTLSHHGSDKRSPSPIPHPRRNREIETALTEHAICVAITTDADVVDF